MTDRTPTERRKKRTSRPAVRPVPRPLDRERLQELALAYVARFSTTQAKLEGYLSRKLRERGWNSGDDNNDDWPDLAVISGRFVELGYIDDEAYARSRTGGLLRRGYGPRRVTQDLYAAGIDETIRAAVEPEELHIRRAAVALARKRRFGPFAPETVDRERQQKQFAAMVRAGHGFDVVRAVLDAQSVDAAEAWAEEPRSDMDGAGAQERDF